LLSTDARCLVIILGGQCNWSILRKAASRGPSALADILVNWTAIVCVFSKKHCKHFSRGKGKCPFNEKCFYLHAYPDGRVASPRPEQRRRQHRHRNVDYSDVDDDDDDSDVLSVEQVSLYEIVEMLNERIVLLADRLEHSLGPLLHRRTLSASDDD